jgi:aspartyl-tRNA(Asn)/glutamyl-tRNA(Gln) amidotransferase subunit A
MTIRAASRLLDSGLVSCEELSLFCHSLAVAGEDVWGLNAYSSLVPRDVVLDVARESDRRRKNGEILSVFDGIPISLKANIAVKTQPLTAGSLILGFGNPNTPSCGYDADTVQILLRDKGSVLMGMTSMDEFGMGSLGTNSLSSRGQRFTKNPLPFLSYLLWGDSSSMYPTKEHTTDESEWLASIIRLPHDAILEKHYEALEGLNSGPNGETAYSAGGSSCGSAASVAHGSALLSLGTDTGGSVRLPAAWCGIVGLKPSYGLLSRHGIVSYASSFDTVGILANSVDCTAAALDALTQGERSRRDSTFSSFPDPQSHSDNHYYSLCEIGVAQVAASLHPNKSLSGVRIGIPSSFSVQECPTYISDAWSRTAECLEGHGAEIVDLSSDAISPSLVQKALSSYYVLVSAEASSNLSRYDGFRFGVAVVQDPSKFEQDSTSELTPLERQYAATRRLGFGTEVSKRILCGTSVLSSDRFHTHYEAAARLRAQLAKEMTSLLEETVDLLLIPTALSFPPKIQEGELENNTAMFANDVMTVPASLSGLPALSIPISTTGHDPFMAGMQLIGLRMKESLILKSAKVLESVVI